jgi:hypothetical protein
MGKLRSKQLHDLHSSSDFIRLIKSKRNFWAGHVARTWEIISIYKILVGKSEGKRPLEKFRHRFEDNINIDFRDRVWSGSNWLKLMLSGGLLLTR